MRISMKSEAEYQNWTRINGRFRSKSLGSMAILQKAQNDINLDVIYSRAKTFERMAEGIARFKEKELFLILEMIMFKWEGREGVVDGKANVYERGYEDADVVQYAWIGRVNFSDDCLQRTIIHTHTLKKLIMKSK